MTRPKPSYIDRYRDRHGKVRTYYRRNGTRQPIDGDPGTPEWHESYARIHRSFESPISPVSDHDTLRFAVQDYLASLRFKNLAPKSQSTYRGSLDELVEKLGNHKLSEFTRGSIIRIRDTIASRSNSMAILAVATLNAVFEHARDCDVIDRNPAKGVRPPEGHKKTPYRKWSDAEIRLVQGQGDPFARRAMMVLLFTGLRCSDAVTLKRNVIQAGKIDLTTQKNKREVVIPLHTALRDELSRPLPLDVEPMFLMPNRFGRMATVPTIWRTFRKQFEVFGIANPPTTHGLRKNAVSSLVEAGCTPRQIQSLTGQSLQMIEHYAQEYERGELADEAIVKWEQHSKNKSSA